MTLDGTNSYLILGAGEALAIDPGPADSGHLSALVAAAEERACRITAIAVTHGHSDHFPGAAQLAERTGAPVYAHPAARFPHDRIVHDGDEIAVRGAAVRAYEAPGHAMDHLIFWFAPEAALFTGDVIVGRGTVVIAPPGGEMRAYQATLRRLRDEFAHARTLFGGHGEPVREPLEKIEEYIAHREARERQVLGALAAGERTILELTRDIYRDVSPALAGAAEQQVLAYLMALERDGRVRVADPAAASYALVEA
jgi:glyoxylase-like metal-dependent hydrolase (beta-lactamase superfamily II)